jgi:hypothetical protein
MKAKHTHSEIILKTCVIISVSNVPTYFVCRSDGCTQWIPGNQCFLQPHNV